MTKKDLLAALESYRDDALVVINIDGEAFIDEVTVSAGVFDVRSDCMDCHIGCGVEPPKDGCPWLYMCDGEKCDVDAVIVIGG